MNGKVLDNKCPTCGAPLFYNPEVKKWKCNYCENEYSLEDLEKYNNASSLEANTDNVNEDLSNIDKEKEKDNYELKQSENYVLYNCPDCGAEIITDDQTVATFCVYCGNTAIMKNKLVGKFAPDLIIPFKEKKELATEKFVGLRKGRIFMPNGFNSKDNIEKIRGIYIPFFLYDMNISGTINYSGEKITSWTTGNTSYTKTDFYNITRGGEMAFVKVPRDSSTRFQDDIMDSIAPFNYEELEAYNHAYLSGFLAEKYDDDEVKMEEDVKKRAINTAKSEILNYGKTYSGVAIIKSDLVCNNLVRKYALLPVWMVNVKYNDKMYTFAMNGQTGKFIGDVPIDKKKLVIFCILTYIIVFLAVILISYIAFMVR